MEKCLVEASFVGFYGIIKYTFVVGALVVGIIILNL